MNIPVVYEDDWLQVLNKPSGLLTIPAPNKGKRSLLKILNEENAEGFKTNISKIFGDYSLNHVEEIKEGLEI